MNDGLIDQRYCELWVAPPDLMAVACGIAEWLDADGIDFMAIIGSQAVMLGITHHFKSPESTRINFRIAHKAILVLTDSHHNSDCPYCVIDWSIPSYVESAKKAYYEIIGRAAMFEHRDKKYNMTSR